MPGNVSLAEHACPIDQTVATVASLMRSARDGAAWEWPAGGRAFRLQGHLVTHLVRPIVSLSLLSFALASAACSRSEPAAPADAAPPSLHDAGTTTADATAPDAGTKAHARVDAGAPSSASRAAMLRDLAAGRKLAKAKDWTGASKALERALTVAPDDVHVLADLGWVAFQMNDLARAEAVNKRALANAKDPKMRAPILYNVGRVAEAKGDKEAAKRAYAESLTLRDNAEVKKRLASVGGGDEPVATLPCAQPFADVAALCVCLGTKKDEIMQMGDDPLVCKAAASSLTLGDPRVGVVEWGADAVGEKVYLLTVREAGQVRIVAELGRDYEPGAFGVHNTAEVKGGEKKTIGGHDVIVVRSEQNDVDMNMAGLEECSHTAKLETVCALGATVGATTCSAPIPIKVESGCGPGVEPEPSEMDDDMKSTIAEIKKNATSSHATTAWNLAPDGTLTVTVRDGKRDLVDPRALNPRPLWR